MGVSPAFSSAAAGVDDAAEEPAATADGWAGQVEVSTGIDGDVRNEGVARYRALASRHLGDWECGREGSDIVWLNCRTVDSDVRIALAARIQVGSGRGVPPRTTAHTAAGIGQRLRLPVLGTGARAVVDKTVTLYTSRDPAIGSPLVVDVVAAVVGPVTNRDDDVHAVSLALNEKAPRTHMRGASSDSINT